MPELRLRDLKQYGSDVLLHQTVPDTYDSLPNDVSWNDVTNMADELLIRDVVDWLWEECFNCWKLMMGTTTRISFTGSNIAVVVLKFDASHDADKFMSRWEHNLPSMTGAITP